MSSCSTARGSSTGVSRASPIKVESGNTFLFTGSSLLPLHLKKEPLVDFYYQLYSYIFPHSVFLPDTLKVLEYPKCLG